MILTAMGVQKYEQRQWQKLCHCTDHSLPALLFAHNHNHGDDVGGWAAKIWTITMATTMATTMAITMAITMPLHNGIAYLPPNMMTLMIEVQRYWWYPTDYVAIISFFQPSGFCNWKVFFPLIGSSWQIHTTTRLRKPQVYPLHFEEVGDWVASQKMVDNHEVQKSLGLWTGKRQVTHTT